MAPDVIELLKGVDLFSALGTDQLEQLPALVIRKSFGRDETIILEDDDSVQALFLIATGEVKVYLSGSDGRETILSLLSKGVYLWCLFGDLNACNRLGNINRLGEG